MDPLKPHRKENETVDRLLDGRLAVIQSRTGYRFSLDALLLADFVAPEKNARVIDLGAGNGVVALILAARDPSLKLTGLEIQPAMAHRAARGAALNGLSERVAIVEGDVRAARRLFPAAGFDVVVSNPPYRRAASGRTNPDPEKRVARHEIAAALADFVRAGAHLLRRGGRMAVVYPAARAVDLLYQMREGGIEPKRLRLVHSYADSGAVLALAEGTKGGRSEIEIMPALIVYTQDRKYTAEMNGILAGSSEL